MPAWRARLAVAILAAAAPLCLTAERAEAVSTTGTIKLSDNAAVTIGEAASLTAICDSAAPDVIPTFTTLGEHTTATISAVGVFGAQTFAAGAPGRFNVLDNVGWSSPDEFRWFSQSAMNSSPALFTGVQLQFVLRGAADLPSSDALPITDLLLALLDGGSSLTATGGAAQGGFTVRASIDALSIGPTPVVPAPLPPSPIPSGVAMLAGPPLEGEGRGR